ncbi:MULTISPECIES: ABC transporter ATP-binding protein [Lacticaseibacillus]|uniref:ABC transporter ATP-binding protein n=1 Tax=Lacticaseibacillus TaxID=2759736 RepID=UPI00063DC089|nr:MULTISPECIES: ATP-binding cassette domain-containing protein [Lacticaseibacillus]KLI76986.1 sulfonate ABC transporter ATP-binding protein [Lacticaseibacillus casei]
MTNPIVKLQHVEKVYGDKTVLNDIQLNLYPGEFLALVGMSGGGKSTILRLIAGLEAPTAGYLSREKGLVMRVMFQNDRLLPWLTNLDNVSFKNRDPEVISEAKSLLHAVGLTDKSTGYPAQLSGGQKQRLALARALLAKPQLLLLDEPLGALDALTRQRMQDLILKIFTEQKLSTLLITHDVNEAARMADRIIVVRDGQLVAETTGARGQSPEAVAQTAARVLQAILSEEPVTS